MSDRNELLKRVRAALPNTVGPFVGHVTEWHVDPVGRGLAPGVLTTADVLTLCDEVERLAQEQAECYAELMSVLRRFEDGTLHLGYCNGKHDAQLGDPRYICNCPVGRTIKGLRKELKACTAELAQRERERAQWQQRATDEEAAHAALARVLARNVRESAKLETYRVERDQARQEVARLTAAAKQRPGEAVRPDWPEDEELDDVLLCDGLEDAFVGLVERFGQEPIACYDLDRVLDGYVERDGMTWEEAQEFFSFNVIGGWVGERTPCFIRFVRLPPVAA